MAFLDDLECVVRLATLTEDLTRGELAALKRVARYVDKRWNAKVVTNHRTTRSTLERLVAGE